MGPALDDEEEMVVARQLAEGLATTRSPFSGSPTKTNVWKMFGEINNMFLAIYTTMDITLWWWDRTDTCWMPLEETHIGGIQ